MNEQQQWLDEMIDLAESLGKSNIDAVVMSPEMAMAIFQTTFVISYRGYQVLVLEGRRTEIILTNKKAFLEHFTPDFPVGRYPTTEGGHPETGQPQVDAGDRAQDDLQDQDRAVAAAREILQTGADLQTAPGETEPVQVPALVRIHAHIPEKREWSRDKIALILILVLSLLVALSSCSTASDRNERITVDYQLTTGDHGQGTWILPDDARILVRTGRGYTNLEWEAGGLTGLQKEGGILKSNVVDFTVKQRTPTREQREDREMSGGSVLLLALGITLALGLALPVLIYVIDRIDPAETINRWANFVWDTLDRLTGHKREL